MANRKMSLREIARSVGIHHMELVECLTRIHSAVMDSDDDVIVISHDVGTFYKQKRKATRRLLKGVWYDVPANEVLQLRPNRKQESEEKEEDVFITESIQQLRQVSAGSFAFDGSFRFQIPGVFPDGVTPSATKVTAFELVAFEFANVGGVEAEKLDGQSPTNHRTFLNNVELEDWSQEDGFITIPFSGIGGPPSLFGFVSVGVVSRFIVEFEF